MIAEFKAKIRSNTRVFQGFLTQKKASVKAQAFCSKLQGKEVAKSTSWADCTDIIFEHFPYCYDMHTNCKSNGDNTIIKLYKGDNDSASKEDLIETFSLPNSEVFFEKEGDWDWDLIYKDVLEAIIKDKLYKRPKIGKRAAAKLAKEKESLTSELVAQLDEVKNTFVSNSPSEVEVEETESEPTESELI